MIHRLIFFFIFFFSTYLSAQQPLFINYSVKEGLPSSEVYDILEDHNGYIWYATDAGVSRYDGYHFRNYTSADGLPDNTVFGLTEDRHGRIWFRTYSGQLAWWQNDTIHSIGANPAILSGQHKNITISLHVDKEDTIWCGLASSAGYYYKIAPPYEAKDLKIIYYPADMSKGVSVHWLDNDSSFIYSACDANDIGFVISYFRGGIFSQYPIGKNRRLRRWNIPMFARTAGNSFIWAGSSGKGFILKDTTAREITIPLAKIISAKTTPDGSWLGFLQLGVWLYPNSNFEKPPVHYLDGFSVSCVITDHEGGKWFSTLENGVYYLPPGNFTIYNKETGFTGTKIYSVYAQNDSTMWAGCKNGKWCSLIHGKPDKCGAMESSQNILSIDEANPGWLFITSAESGLYEPATGKIISFAGPGMGYATPLMYSFAKNTDGTAWTNGKEKLFRIDLSSGKKIAEYTTPVRISCSCVDQEGLLWLGSLSGLWSFSNGKFTDHSPDDPLLKNRIEYIRFDANGTMWMATRGAGVLYRGKDKKVHRLSSANGLASDICRSLFIDKENLVWVATNHGISCIDSRNGIISIHNFGIAGDLLGEVNSIARTGDTLWAGTGEGLVAFNIRFVFLQPSDPPIHLVSVMVNGKNIPGLPAPLELKHDENSLSFSFVGLSYKAHGNLSYRYRLEGLETEWTTTTATQIEYARLPPGNYRFVAAIIRTDGTVGSHIASLAFNIATPFWKSWWFITLCSVLFCVTVLLLFRYRLQLERDRSQTTNRITLLELTALRAQMNPHFIFNAMNSIQHFILNNDKLSAQKYLSQFSRLIRGVLENSKQSTITLDQETEALQLYTGLEKLRASRPFTVTIETDKKVKTDTVRIPPLIIQPYVENAILHGLMPLRDREGHLSITFRMSGDLLECVIDDNGVGRQKAKERSQSDIHHSVGLSITGRRIEILNQDNKETIGVTIEDKISAQGKPEGTRVILLIPAK